MTRPVHIFVVPAELTVPIEEGGDAHILRLGIVELTPGEEIMAIRRAENEITRMAFEQARESLRVVFIGVPGTPKEKQKPVQVSTADASSEKLWARMGAPLRTLAVTAYGKVHQPTQKEAADFLASREVVSG